MDKLFNNVVVGWVSRRLLEVGGWVTFVTSIYMAMPPSAQAAVGRILRGDWDNLSVAAIIGLVTYVWSQVWSFKSTVKDQVVASGRKAPLDAVADALPPNVTKTLVEQKVETIATRKRPSILDWFKRK